jgi:signal peptidase I
MGESAKISSNRRRCWVAGLLNLLGGFGVGYLYVGRPVRALMAAGTSILTLFILWHGLWGWLAKPWMVFLVLALFLFLSLAYLVDAILIARRSPDFAVRWYNRWWVYLAVVVVGTAFGPLGDVKRRSVRTFATTAASMEPTLRVGDLFIVDMRAFESREPERGDVVIFELPRDRATLYVKRVIGLPADEVQVKDGLLHINGESVPTYDEGSYVGGPGWPEQGIPLKREVLAKERMALVLGSTPDHHYNTPVFKVPPASYFVLGDNRDNSLDSREQSPRYGVGYVPRTNIIGKASWVFWSSHRSRIGRTID